MPSFICTACGTQYPESAQPPAACCICEEERQYVPPRGQSWTTLEALAQSHMNSFREYDTGVIGIGAGFAIGQRALLLRTGGGNILWDCVATLDAATVTLIKGLGGLKAIAISHPHFYTTMDEWARAFDCPIHLNAADKDWIVNPSPAVKLWERRHLSIMGRRDAHPLRRPFRRRHRAALGARRRRPRHRLRRRHPHRHHRPQMAVVHAQLSEFHSASMRARCEHIGAALAPFSFDMLYGHYFDRVIAPDAKAVLEKSVARYIDAVEGKRGY